MLYENLFFYVSTAFILVCSAGIVWTKNIVHSCVFLLGVLLGTAGLYISLGADFVAGIQLLVYVGGIVVLMLFAIMLTGGHNYMSKEFFHQLVPLMGNRKTYITGALVSGVFLIPAIGLIRKASLLEKTDLTVGPIAMVSTTEKLGELLITDYVLAFEIVSVLLLGALVAAAVIARPAKKRF